MSSLTTDCGNLFPDENLLDKDMDKATNKSSCGKAKTVVSRLVSNWCTYYCDFVLKTSGIERMIFNKINYFR